MIQFDFVIEHLGAEIGLVCEAAVYGRYCPPTTVCPGEHPELEVISTIVEIITDEEGENRQEYHGYRVGEDTNQFTRAQLLSLQDAAWKAVRHAIKKWY